ncbi:MAG: hypothetical protein OXD44_00275 [Gammaproteobacteria bacterium]|nr:hypothetical protein [Gammaproteobacteria bacterium]
MAAGKGIPEAALVHVRSWLLRLNPVRFPEVCQGGRSCLRTASERDMNWTSGLALPVSSAY